MLRDHPVFPWLDPPTERGATTVIDAAAAAPDELGDVVRRWAASVWAAWAAHHVAIRERTGAELAGR
jgi:hypothetical protein